jgi:hypothetical protein
MTENSMHQIRETSENVYVTSSFRSGTAAIWGEPVLITQEMTGQVINGVYVHIIPTTESASDIDPDLWDEIKMWEDASVNDWAQFNDRLDKE